jgi:hypothetical protein
MFHRIFFKYFFFQNYTTFVAQVARKFAQRLHRRLGAIADKLQKQRNHQKSPLLVLFPKTATGPTVASPSPQRIDEV